MFSSPRPKGYLDRKDKMQELFLHGVELNINGTICTIYKCGITDPENISPEEASDGFLFLGGLLAGGLEKAKLLSPGIELIQVLLAKGDFPYDYFYCEFSLKEKQFTFKKRTTEDYNVSDKEIKRYLIYLGVLLTSGEKAMIWEMENLLSFITPSKRPHL